jgi:hypothetical protein
MRHRIEFVLSRMALASRLQQKLPSRCLTRKAALLQSQRPRRNPPSSRLSGSESPLFPSELAVRRVGHEAVFPLTQGDNPLRQGISHSRTGKQSLASWGKSLGLGDLPLASGDGFSAARGLPPEAGDSSRAAVFFPPTIPFPRQVEESIEPIREFRFENSISQTS